MREERSRLRTQVYILEKERATNEAQQQANAATFRSQNAAVSPYGKQCAKAHNSYSSFFTFRDLMQM